MTNKNCEGCRFKTDEETCGIDGEPLENIADCFSYEPEPDWQSMGYKTREDYEQDIKKFRAFNKALKEASFLFAETYDPDIALKRFYKILKKEGYELNAAREFEEQIPDHGERSEEGN